MTKKKKKKNGLTRLASGLSTQLVSNIKQVADVC